MRIGARLTVTETASRCVFLFSPGFCEGRVTQLEYAIYDYIERNNADPKPFVWTKSADEIIR